MSQGKTFLKVLGMESLYMLLLTLSAAGAALLQSCFKAYGGEYSNIIFSGSNYRYNFFMYIIGILVYFGIVIFLYKKCFAKSFEQVAGLHILLKIITWIILAIWGVIMLFTEMMALIGVVLGLANNLLPEACLNFTVFGWPVLTLIFIGVMTVVNLKKAKSK